MALLRVFRGNVGLGQDVVYGFFPADWIEIHVDPANEASCRIPRGRGAQAT